MRRPSSGAILSVPMTPRRPSGFTLVELLTVIAIVALLAGLMLPAFHAYRAKADLATGLSNLRQIGVAVQSYASENNQFLPCVFSGQNPWYRKWSTNSLGQNLWRYLGAPAPNDQWQEAKVLGSPPYFRARSANNVNNLYLNFSVPSATNTNVTFSPWGNPTGGAAPMKLLHLSQAGLSRTWAMVDVDKTLIDNPPPPTRPFRPGWYSALPDKPMYGSMRTFLYFDWSAKAVPVGSNP